MTTHAPCAVHARGHFRAVPFVRAFLPRKIGVTLVLPPSWRFEASDSAHKRTRYKRSSLSSTKSAAAAVSSWRLNAASSAVVTAATVSCRTTTHPRYKQFSLSSTNSAAAVVSSWRFNALASRPVVTAATLSGRTTAHPRYQPVPFSLKRGVKSAVGEEAIRRRITDGVRTAAIGRADVIGRVAGIDGAATRDEWDFEAVQFASAGSFEAGAVAAPPGRNAADKAAAAAPIISDQWFERSAGIKQHLAERLRIVGLLTEAVRDESRGGVTCGTPERYTVTSSTPERHAVTSSTVQGDMWGYNSVGTERYAAIGVMFLLALSICLWIDSNTAADLLVAGIRAVVQLSAVGFGLKYIFTIESAAVAYLGVAVMVLAAAHTASRRAKEVPGSFWVALVAVGAAVALALSLIVALQVVRLQPRFVIPISGIVVGSSMTIAANTMQRLADDFGQRRGQVEAALALGASQWEASLPLLRRALAVGFGPTLDYIKTYGVIQLPGAMVGMLLGGLPPQEAVYLQLTLTFFMLVPLAFTTVVSAVLTARCFFSAPGQLG